MIKKWIIPMTLVLLAFSLVLFGVFTEQLEPITRYMNQIVATSMKPSAKGLISAGNSYGIEGYVQSVDSETLTIISAYNGEYVELWAINDPVFLETQATALSGPAKNVGVLSPDEAIKYFVPGQAVLFEGFSGDADNPPRATHITLILNGGFNTDGKMEGGRDETVVMPQDAKDPTNSNKPYPSYLYRIQKSPW